MPVAGAYCSFCGKADELVERLIAGPGAYICNECVGLCNEILSRESTDGFGDLDQHTDEDLLARMARLDASRAQVEHAVEQCAATLRERGVSWSKIGEALGTSRQSAWERFTADA